MGTATPAQLRQWRNRNRDGGVADSQNNNAGWRPKESEAHRFGKLRQMEQGAAT
jgi:hypothetical protein